MTGPLITRESAAAIGWSRSYERTLHAARCTDGLPDRLAATIAIIALRYGPHGRLRAPCLHLRAVHAEVVPALSCPDCGAVFRRRA